MDPKIEERICDDKRPGFRPTCEGYGGDAVRGYPKGCGRGAQRANTEGKPVVTLVAVGEIDLRIKWACADCIERSGLDIPTEVPQRCRCMNPGCSRPCRSNTNFWRFCGTECTDKLRKIVDERKAIHERQKRGKEAHQALASGVLALEPGVKRESSADTIKVITSPAAHKEARDKTLAKKCAYENCTVAASLDHCYRDPYAERRKYFCGREHMEAYAMGTMRKCVRTSCDLPASLQYFHRPVYQANVVWFCSAECKNKWPSDPGLRTPAPGSRVQGHSELTTGPRKEARHDFTTWTVDPSDPGLRTPALEQTDGIVQKEVSDEWQTVSTHGGESQAAQLVRERYATWAKRARKWHAYLERERAWSTHGRLLSVLTGAASTLAAATVAPHYAPLVVGALMIATALIAWRGQVAQSRLESSRAADAWVSADRLAEVYKGLVVELDAALAHGGQGAKWVSETLAKSQQIEGAARFGVPEGLRSVLVEVCK